MIIARKLNFKPTFYLPENIKNERWGSLLNDSFTGLFGEAIDASAAFYLGDLYQITRHLQILDLSWPYNTECLTFLTLESLTENSWKLLILSFRYIEWNWIFIFDWQNLLGNERIIFSYYLYQTLFLDNGHINFDSCWTYSFCVCASLQKSYWDWIIL